MIDKNASCAVEPLLPVELGAGKIKFAQGVKAGRWVFATGLMAQDFVNGVAPFMSALMAADRDGIVASAATDPRQPWFSSSPEAQAEFIIGNIARLCEAAGTSLANVVRVQQFHTDISEFYPVYKVWERALGGRPLPFSAVEVPSPLPVPGATVLIEAWAYVP